MEECKSRKIATSETARDGLSIEALHQSADRARCGGTRHKLVVGDTAVAGRASAAIYALTRHRFSRN